VRRRGTIAGELPLREDTVDGVTVRGFGVCAALRKCPAARVRLAASWYCRARPRCAANFFRYVLWRTDRAARSAQTFPSSSMMESEMRSKTGVNGAGKNARRIGAVAGLAAVLVLGAGCTQKPTSAAIAVKDKVYAVTPDVLKVRSALVSGEFSDMKVTERVEEISGKVTTPAMLSGKLLLKNMSADQSVQLVGTKFVFVDMQGKAIPFEAGRLATSMKMSGQYGAGERRLEPGQESSQAVETEFPAEALNAKRLREIRIDVAYLPSPYRQDALSFPVTIGAK